MPKILRAYGPSGRKDGDWNWCAEGEPVGTHGFVCDNACSCGCSRSFIGIESCTACTRAVVDEVSDADYAAMRERLHKETLSAWGNSQSVAEEAVRCFDEITGRLHFPVGTVLRIRKDDTSMTLTKDLE